MAPLLTDLPIILLSVLLLGRLPPHVLRWVGLVGGLVLIWLGVEGIRAARKAQLPTDDGRASDPSRDLWRGAAVNALNPNPYLFWGTVGGPVLLACPGLSGALLRPAGRVADGHGLVGEPPGWPAVAGLVPASVDRLWVVDAGVGWIADLEDVKTWAGL